MSYKKFSLYVSAILIMSPWILAGQQNTGTRPAQAAQTNNGNSNQNNNKNGVSDQSGGPAVQAETLRASDETTAVKIEVTAEPIQALPQPNAISKDGEEHGAANLSLQSESVTPGSYIQTGIGPSVAGRPNSANNFEINGIDNNNQTAPGPIFPISNEAVTNFTIVQGDAVSQLAHSTGGQMNQIVTQGTNLWHGGIYDYLNTRKLNAVEPSLASGLRTQRYDQNRMGLNAGGPLIHNKLFAFVNMEYLPLRASRVQVPPIFVPTAAGYAAAAGIPGLSAVNLNVLGSTAGVATTATTFTTINGTVVPLGPADTEVRVRSDQVNGIANLDWRMGSDSKASLQYGHYDVKTNSFGTTLPGFQVPGRTRAMFGAVSYTRAFDTGTTFSTNIGYNRSEITVGDGDFAFTGLSAFPSIEIQNVGLTLGTDFSTRRVRSNMYQFGGWAEQAISGHRIRTGVDIRVLNSAFGSLASDAGILGYSTLDRFLLDLPPDAGAQRSFGSNSFSGNRVLLNAFLQDRMRYRGVNIDAGLSAQYSQLPASVRRQTNLTGLNIPGVIDFGRAWPDRINLAPQIGVSFSPGTERVTIRSGFGMLYDALGVANGLVSTEMPFTTLSAATAASTVPGFLANGGLAAPLTVANGVNTVAFDQQLPYIEHWNAGLSYVLFGRLTAEVKYLGNHGVHQAEETILNNPTGVSAAASLPVFFTNPGLPVLNSLTLTQAALLTQPNAFTAAGFTNPIVATRNDGTSWYNAAVLKLNQRFSGGTQVTGQYTWADTRSDTTGTSLDLLYGRRMEQSLWVASIARH